MYISTLIRQHLYIRSTSIFKRLFTRTNLVRHRNLLLIPFLTNQRMLSTLLSTLQNFDHDVDSALQFLHLPNERQGWIYIHQGSRADDQHPEEHPHPIAQLPVGRHHARAGDVRLTP